MAGVRAAAARAEARLELLADGTGVPPWSELDGLLISAADASHARARIPAGMPCVSLLVRVPGLPSVVADDERAAGDLTRHLLYLGHRRIAYLTMLQPGQDEGGNPICARRVAGYRSALAAAGIAADPRWLHAMADQDHADGFIGRGQRDMAAWLRDGFGASGCTALLAQNDETAVGALSALAAAGVAVPAQVSVVGFDGSALGMLCSPRLTTVAVPLGEIGRRGMELLLAHIASGSGSGDSGELVLAATLLPRGTSAPAPLPPPRHRRRAHA
jgi:LacI family transcriptional regulator